MTVEVLYPSVYFGLQRQFDSDGIVINNTTFSVKNIYLNGVRIAAVLPDGQSRYYLTDQVDSVKVVVDDEGLSITRFEYLPYGETWFTEEKTGLEEEHNPKFNSRELDKETVYYFYNTRHYDPEIAWFVTADNVIDGEGDTQGWNQFSNVQRSPLMKQEERLIDIYSTRGLTHGVVRCFREIIRRQYRSFGRSQPWRETRDPYSILVSEIMLQQTTVERVMDKYPRFIDRFPCFYALADAPLSDLLREWQGLGYNRRALNLHKLSHQVVSKHKGELPSERETLLNLPGIGPYTAGAIQAFAFDLPAVLIETNIRRVFLHFFFSGNSDVHDREIFPLIRRTLDRKDPRSWYYGLMDYGTDLKKRVTNPNMRSRHYSRQSPFEGSHRQMRSRILRALLDSPGITPSQLAKKCEMETKKAKEILRELEGEGFPV